MASEVFAEDIEALLERLEGVASARVVANDAGAIDAIYITAAGALDEITLRRSIAAALMSSYSLAVDGWRIRVARLRAEIPRSRWRLQRVEEVLTATATRVTVELRGDGDRGPVLTGRARGLPDRANRMRTVVLATLDALKTVLDAEERRATLETISTVPLIGKEAVVVAVSMSEVAQSSLCVGAAVNEGVEADALIVATLDAVAKREPRLQQRGWVMKDRRDQLESMRAHYRRLRMPQRQMPALSPVEGPARNAVVEPAPSGVEDGRIDEPILRAVPGGKLVDEPTLRGVEEAGLETIGEPVLGDAEEPRGDAEALPQSGTAGPPRYPAATPGLRPVDRPTVRTAPATDEPVEAARNLHADGSREMREDTVTSLEQIRPERAGGAAVAAVGHRYEAERNRAAEQAAVKPGSKGAMEDDFFRHLVVTGLPVHIRCRDGYEIAEAVLKDFGTYTLLVETDAGKELIFKHGIISIRPLRATAG